MTRPDQTRPDQTRPDQTRPDRDSALELLRIIAMLIIILHHFAGISGFSFPDESTSVNAVLMKYLASMSTAHIGDNMFVLLSGYFLVKSRNFKFGKILGLWFCVLFYSVSIFALCVVSGITKCESASPSSVFLPIITRHWWFISCYFILYLLHTRLNDVLCRIDQKGCLTLVVMTFILWSGVLITNRDVEFDKVIDFVCLYSIAGYIRLWADDVGGRKYIVLGAVCIVMNFAVIYLLERIGFGVDSIADKKIYPIHYLHGMMGIFNVSACVCMLLGFKNLNLGHNRIINLFASASLGIYLIHENRFFKPYLWRNIVKGASFQDSPYLMLYVIIAVVGVYVSCALIELMRSRLFRVVSGGRMF